MKTPSQHRRTEKGPCPTAQVAQGMSARWSRRVAMLCIHALGIVSVSVLVSWLVSDASVIKLLVFDASGVDAASYTRGILLHMLYSMGIWATLVLTVKMIKGRAKQSPHKPQVIRLARGQVMVETLLVITPFLLLTGGLSQLIINNIAGMLSHLSAYQAGRTYWVWAQEHEREGAAISDTIACQRAHLAAAAVLTPVASGPSSAGGDPQFEKLAGIMAAHFSDQTTAPRGSSMGISADSSLTPESYKDAFDTSPFSKRATQKLRAAYENTTVTCTQGSQLSVNVTYDHYLAFPWFGYIFSNSPNDGYTRFTRTYQLPLQVPPK